MLTSIFIAKLMGPILVVVAISILIDEKTIRAMAKEVMSSHALLYIFGTIDLLLGLVLVTVHNVWVMDWRVIITLIGWVRILRGPGRVFFSTLLLEKRAQNAQKRGAVNGHCHRRAHSRRRAELLRLSDLTRIGACHEYPRSTI